MNKVLCPWCGHEMELEHFGIDEDESFVYVCPDCAAVSPVSYSEESARATALARPLQKLLTLEELQSAPAGTVVWMEQNVSLPVLEAVVSDGNGKYGNFYIGVKPYTTEPKFARYWAAKPTDEEREAAKWE